MYLRTAFRSIKHFHVNVVIKILILSDLIIWSAYNLLAPVFAIFITEQIPGASLESVGIAAGLYFIVKAIAEVPVGIYLDKMKGEKDELYSALIGTMLTAFVYFSYSFVDSVWHLYVLQIILGMAAALSFPGWYSIFSRHVDQEKRAMEWSMYDISLGIGIALASTLGAFIADKFGFQILFVIIGIFTCLGSLSLLIIKNKLYKD